MTFFAPTYLWALLGIFVPIAIHLWNKKKVQVIKIGSTQLLKELEPRQANNIQLNEWVLLLLRMLLCALLALIMAGPRIMRTEARVPLTYIVEPSLVQEGKLHGFLDSLPAHSVRLLKPGLPEWRGEDFSTEPGVPNYWQLAREMENLETDSITVFAKGYVKGVKGMRPTLGSNIHWVLMDDSGIFRETVEVTSFGNEVEIVRATSDEDRLRYVKERKAPDSPDMQWNGNRDSVKIGNKDSSVTLPVIIAAPIKARIVYTDSTENEMRFIESAFRAISKYSGRPIEMHKQLEPDTLGTDTDILIWLTSSPASKEATCTLLYRPDNLESELIVPGPVKNTFHLTRSLDFENSTEGRLAEHLISMLDFYPDIKREDYDRRVMDVGELEPIRSERSDKKNRTVLFDLSPYFWILMGIFLLIERILAKYRRQ